MLFISFYDSFQTMVNDVTGDIRYVII